jgi:hypothetical protein
MELLEVNNNNLARDFIALPKKIYNNDPNWICPLDTDIKSVFDPIHNIFFTHGSCTRFVLKDNKETIGRIAAFINYKKTENDTFPVGGIGFFECVNKKDAAFLLFDKAKEWLKEKGMLAMDGPINFGENDKYWGLLVEGFKPPSIYMNYNPPWYIELFESYGFQKQYDQLTNYLDVTIPFTERFTKIADWVIKKPGYSFSHISIKHFDKYARDFQEIYNDAWSEFEHFTPLEIETIRESFEQLKPVFDEKIVWFAYYNDEPIAFFVCIPDVNQILKHLNGKTNLLGKLKFLYYTKTRTIDRLRAITMGCKKKFQNKGVESALIRSLQLEVVPRNTIKGVELSWVGDFNKKMLAIHEATGAVKDKVHRTYRYLFQ